MPGRRSGDRRTSQSQSQSRSIVDNFRRGDKIQVFSAGRQLDGNGTFIRAEGGFLVWEDNSGNRNTTSLESISVRRLRKRNC
ncbi:hypothetical protein [Priestia megaterium]|uniref:hypothetical protein n=1 Tax=Priestia megaterium TaxID=1404 RepID=UPI001F1077F2